MRGVRRGRAANKYCVKGDRGRTTAWGTAFHGITAVAKAITGQHVSGPRFFGMVARKENRA